MNAAIDHVPLTTPRDRTMALIEEVLWWHNQFGNPVTVSEVVGGQRCSKQRIVWPLRDCIHRIRAKQGLSTPELGRLFKRDHSTILHHLNPQVQKKKYEQRQALNHRVVEKRRDPIAQDSSEDSRVAQ